ncbi:hypothetical protein GCM10011367_17260 [Marinicauda pacifica]|uniref:site-specific DNA-methyltransferase (adenine-specific) n=1 Tax=Marinicauda pacifica TaxID=1133559 RepID=A0A4S2HCD4_9PROT|nr:N-6 DNA methylase [Marinicauda pacifica]TGY93132.1 hypothetical protein E5162_08705 [Marinicauda pacifica]GGE43136.1 hypothetical protein GCM10011367_17260 [Marinicauda pacifica]
MSSRRRSAGRLELEAVSIIGGLLSPDLVNRVAKFEASQTKPENYEVKPGLALRDEIARAFRIAQAHWEKFEASRENLAASEHFVLNLLTDCFGFEGIEKRGTVHLNGRDFPIRHAALDGRVPIVIAPAAKSEDAKDGIDTLQEAFADETRRRTATTLLQEYLNAEDGALWGLASDGVKLRLLRDNASLTRSAYVEADLERIFNETLFADFSALWLLAHQTRFGVAGTPVSDCPLERWRDTGKEEGAAAREQLRDGVESAIQALGRGFLAHPDNGELRRAMGEGDLSAQAYFTELLRLVYRLIFLFAAEDRNLLHPASAPKRARELYRAGYSLSRLRDRCTRRTAWDRHVDVWQGLRATFQALWRGEPKLGLPALGGLFGHGQSPHLKTSEIENRAILEAIWRLTWFMPKGGERLVRVNWRDMETEELGSIYESLLELTPRVTNDGRGFRLDHGVGGHERKTTGSYYTPDSLVQLLLDTTLDPVLDAAEARNPSDPVSEILKLSIIDPACGSGHFLLAAARRAASRIATHRTGGAPSLEAQQAALRDVVSHCIFGVDRNPMAVELCKVALWIEAIEPGKPLTFLDSHIRCGDSLIGVFDYSMLKAGVPDEAFKPLTGDDKAAASAWKKINKQQREGKAATGFLKEIGPPEGLVSEAQRILAMSEDTLDEIEAKRKAFEKLHSGQKWLSLKTASDLYVAAFFTPKTEAPPQMQALRTATMPTTEAVWRAANGEQIYGPLAAHAIDTAGDQSAFHWPLEFPQIFARGGFDAVVGNPPWEVSQLGEVEYFSARAPEIAALKGDKRKKAIARLEEEHPELWAAYVLDKRNFDGSNEFVRASGRFKLTASGKINTYALFAEHFLRLARQAPTPEPAKSLAAVIAETGNVKRVPAGRAGVIVPTGIATDSSTAAFFGNLVDQHRIATLIDFENRDALFPGVHRSYKFSILSIGLADLAEFAFFLSDPKQLEHKERRFTLSPEQIKAINPNTKTAPVFRSRADAQLTAKIYEQAPVLIEERPAENGGDVNPWGISFQQGLFNMTSASDLFRTKGELLAEGWERDSAEWVKAGKRYVPLYEAKMIHHFDHRWASYDAGGDEEGARDVTLAEKQDPNFEPEPRYWVPEGEVTLRSSRAPSRLKTAWRNGDETKCHALLAEWVVGALIGMGADPVREPKLAEDAIRKALGARALEKKTLGAAFSTWLGKAAANGGAGQVSAPLDEDDLAFMAEGRDSVLDLAAALIERKEPRWLMGWRDICRSTDERTVIASVLPLLGVGHTMPLFRANASPLQIACFLAEWSCLSLDYIARLKVGGTHLTYSYLKQFPFLRRNKIGREEREYLVVRVLELTYTSHAMKPWAEDLGYAGPPFAWDEDRRAKLRAELDAFFARKYGLTRDELRYILDPADVKGEDYPSETFRVLKYNEMRRFGEYRTQRLVLEAFDRLTTGDLVGVGA